MCVFRFGKSRPQKYYSREVNLDNIIPSFGWQFNSSSNSWEVKRCEMAKIKLVDLNRAFGIKLTNKMSIAEKYSTLSLNTPVYASDIKVSNR